MIDTKHTHKNWGCIWSYTQIKMCWVRTKQQHCADFQNQIISGKKGSGAKVNLRKVENLFCEDYRYPPSQIPLNDA
jgi:hypothetical protein